MPTRLSLDSPSALDLYVEVDEVKLAVRRRHGGGGGGAGCRQDGCDRNEQLPHCISFVAIDALTQDCGKRQTPPSDFSDRGTGWSSERVEVRGIEPLASTVRLLRSAN